MSNKHNEPRRHKIPQAKRKVANWPEYDRALQHRSGLTVWVMPEALTAWTPAKPQTLQQNLQRLVLKRMHDAEHLKEHFR